MQEYDLLRMVSETKFIKSKKFETVPQGIYINDIFNFGDLSLNTEENFDLFKNDSFNAYRTFRKRFTKQFKIDENSFLPYHYVAMYVDGEVHIVSTRPISYKTPIIDYEEYLTIAILGSAHVDIYVSEFYEQLANLINGLRYMRGYSHETKYNVVVGKELDDSYFHKELLNRNLV